MSGAGEVLVALGMLVGLVGVVVPVLPGLLLVWACGLAWVLLDGGGPARWATLAVMTALLVAGTLLQYVLPGRATRKAAASRATLWVAAAGAVAGFFLVPVVGVVLGFVAGAYLCELAATRDLAAAWRSTVVVLKGVGLGMLLQLLAGGLMIAVWVTAVVAT